MKIISEDEFNEEAENLEEESEILKIKKLTDETFQELLKKMENPVLAQKELAVQIKHFLDQHIEREMEEKGRLSDFTRRWVDAYNNILEKIQKALYGDKSINLHLHKISHSDIASKIREVSLE